MLAYSKSLSLLKESLLTLFRLRFSVSFSTCANCDLIRELKALSEFQRVALRAISIHCSL